MARTGGDGIGMARTGMAGIMLYWLGSSGMDGRGAESRGAVRYGLAATEALGMAKFEGDRQRLDWQQGLGAE